MQKLERAGMRIPPTKSMFSKTEVGFLGFLVITDGVRTCPEKERAILELKPKELEESRSFLGLWLLQKIYDVLLAYPDYSKVFELTTDASSVTLGAVLSQNGRPITMISRTLFTSEANYATNERELLANEIVTAEHKRAHRALQENFRQIRKKEKKYQRKPSKVLNNNSASCPTRSADDVPKIIHAGDGVIILMFKKRVSLRENQ
ncbi:Retrovirus-related Pol polyprotein from transposon gypsy [Eumeta japonica]|uniref:Retrovirus-related Pol polyprotein from transposon gypsy n=1 Tax=Eumeta variegata TaxID=151549 RepID=A0A4C2ABF1_EUMVA|nr:Retrovirus-related Pol polyprotein from transposon gypsy [Eumeta japonica]